MMSGKKKEETVLKSCFRSRQTFDSALYMCPAVHSVIISMSMDSIPFPFHSILWKVLQTTGAKGFISCFQNSVANLNTRLHISSQVGSLNDLRT